MCSFLQSLSKFGLRLVKESSMSVASSLDFCLTLFIMFIASSLVNYHGTGKDTDNVSYKARNNNKASSRP